MKEYNHLKKLLLRELSENSRISVTELARKLKCSRNTVIKNLASVEKEFSIRYTIELARTPLAMQNQLTTMRFGIKPSKKELEKIFEDTKYLPLVLLTDGDFDVLIKQVGDQSLEYMDWALDFIKKVLPYRPSFKTSIIDNVTLGFVPFPSDILMRLDMSKMGIAPDDKKLLVLLNEDSRMSHVQMAKKLGIDVGTAKYRMKRLIKTNIIRRFTIVLQKPPLDYSIASFMTFDLAPGIFERARKSIAHYQKVDENLPLINSFQYVTGLIGTYSTFYLAEFENEDIGIKNTVLTFKDMFKEDNVTLVYAKVTKVVKGSLPARNIDIASEMAPTITLLDTIRRTKGYI